MEFKQIIELIQAVSESALTSFKYKEGDTSITLEANRNVVYQTVSEAPASAQVLVETKINNDNAVSQNKIITSPMVGTFYAAKSEDSDPYIAIGDVIKKGQVIGIVEAMKLMNEIESEYDGVVEAILVQNKGMIEYGQPLVSIKPL